MNQDSPFSDLVLALYDAALDPVAWAPLAPRIAKAFDAGSCQAQVRDLSLGSMNSLTRTTNYTAKLLSEHAEHYHQHDVWVAGASRQSFGDVYGSDDLIADRDFERLEFYQDFCRRLGIFYVAGSVLRLGPQEIGVFGLHRGREEGLFSREEKRRISLLMPHIQRSLQIRSRLGTHDAQARLGFDLLHALMVPLIVVDGQGQIIFANREAERIMRDADGLICLSGVLTVADSSAAGTLRRLIGTAIAVSRGEDEFPGGTLAIRRRLGRPLSLLVAPVPQRSMALGQTRPIALIIIGDPDRRATPTHQALARLYGLTRAEARLLGSLLTGERLQDYTERVGISINTAKTQLAQVFQKTGQDRQSALVGEISANPIWIGQPCQDPENG
jgi:PAS domain-containing protein